MLLSLTAVACGPRAPSSGAAHSNPKPSLQAAFSAIADDFRAKPSTNRFEESKRLCAALPRCPVTWSSGTARAYDYTRPSFRLSKKQLIAALGPPLTVDTHAGWFERVSYEVMTNGLGPWYLEVELRDGHVVGSTIRIEPLE